METADYDQAPLPELLPLYYRRLFPFSQYYRWPKYGGKLLQCCRHLPKVLDSDDHCHPYRGQSPWRCLWFPALRGVHCWVCDKATRKLSVLRSAVSEYLSLVKDEDETVRKVVLSDSIQSLVVVEHHFPQYFLVGQDILGNKEVADKVLSLMPKDVRKELLRCFQTEKNPEKRWGRLKTGLKQTYNCQGAPFSIHPKTRGISVPIDLRKLDRFDPFDVPTISLICELDRPKTIRDYKQTSLAKDGSFMERGHLKKSDLQKDF
uniref:DNA primase AEP n=1 Tax=Oncorhynchus tshawytscha TaxID=74940 RepID=A0A8C8EMD9_ONCTS